MKSLKVKVFNFKNIKDVLHFTNGSGIYKDLEQPCRNSMLSLVFSNSRAVLDVQSRYFVLQISRILLKGLTLDWSMKDSFTCSLHGCSLSLQILWCWNQTVSFLFSTGKKYTKMRSAWTAICQCFFQVRTFVFTTASPFRLLVFSHFTFNA